MKFNISKIIKNPARLALKVFILIWFFLIVQIVLKVTFNYWQPYVIPTPQLEKLSDFIDRNRWIDIIINGILYIINGVVMILCSIKRWWFKDKKQTYLIIGILLANYVIATFLYKSVLITLFLSIGVPIIIDKSKWKYTIATFALNFVFTYLSLFLEGFTNSNDMPNIIKIMLNFDYYIMLAINYMTFNLLQFKKGDETNG